MLSLPEVQAIFFRRRHQPRRPPLARICGLTMSQGNSGTNGISDRNSNSQSDCEDHRDIGHNLSSPNSANGFCSSSLLTTAARQEKKNTASQDKARQSRAHDRTRDSRAVEIKGRVKRSLASDAPEFIEYVRALPVERGRGTATGRALLEGRVIHIADVLADPDYTWAEAQRLGGYRTVLGVPMLREGNPTGVLTLTRSEMRPFSEKQIELVSNFADQAAIAIENVRLFDEIQDKSRPLAEASERKSQFLASMSHELRTKTVLRPRGHNRGTPAPPGDVDDAETPTGELVMHEVERTGVSALGSPLEVAPILGFLRSSEG
jgi:hypothetical protein